MMVHRYRHFLALGALLGLLVSAPSRGASAQTVSDEFRLDPMHSAPGTLQWNPAMAAGDEVHLAAWRDDRNLEDAIYVARLSPNGSVLDARALEISGGAEPTDDPVVGFNGLNFLVVWKEWQAGDTYRIRAARVTEDGSLLDATPTIVDTVNNLFVQGIARLGSNTYLIYQSSREIRGVRINAAGAVLDDTPDVFELSGGAAAIGSSGSIALVAWSEGRSGRGSEIYGRRVDESGTLLEEEAFPIGSTVEDQWTPTVASDGTDFYVAWIDRRADQNELYGTRVKADGTVLDPIGEFIASGPVVFPSMAFDGQAYWVAWLASDGTVAGRRAAPQNGFLDEMPIDIGTAWVVEPVQTGVGMASSGSNDLVVGYAREISQDGSTARRACARRITTPVTGEPDAGTPDGRTDGGTFDAAVDDDAGPSSGGSGGGCAVGTGRAKPRALAGLLVLLAVTCGSRVKRRRRAT